VVLGENVGVWFNAVLRGDSEAIVIGDGSNIQDNASGHGDPGSPLRVGRNVSVGHNAVIHGCTIDDNCLIGMGAIILDGAQIGARSIIGAGAVVTQNKIIPPGSMVMGTPAKVVRQLSPDEQANLRSWADRYIRLIPHYHHLGLADPAFSTQADGLHS
jgi:carbonic anhydrase/acetyltransferase-like protein (isoleucine patch superfamily)